ncbi:MAG: endolytic transglycosylase MltG [Desulfitobacteriaceae bacterium]
MAGKRIIGSGFLILVLLAWGVGLWWQWAVKPCSTTGNMQLLAVLPGATPNLIAQELEQRKLIRNASVFYFMARTRQQNFKLLPGEYYISSSMSPQSIIDRLLKGPDVELARVTIPEGYNSDQIINLLVQKGLGTKESFIKVVTSESFPYLFLKGAPVGVHRLEGFLFPDTYFFKKGDGSRAIIDTMLQRFNQELTLDTQKQLDNLKISVRDWVIMASLVEKEALKEVDRPLIASVFFNRLKKSMPLQIDATIQFILGTPKLKLLNSDLQRPSPYNTYLHKGLPPGPIANPGHASLQAVLKPAQSEYLYYLARNDGYHIFATTFDEHLLNQKKYQ